jgi:hypothetical protein
VTAAEYLYVARHEAAHAAACVQLGYLPCEIWVDPGSGRGHVMHTLGDAKDLRAEILIRLAGWIANDENPPDWPLVPTRTKSDFNDVAEAIHELGLIKGEYRQLVIDAYYMAAHSEFDLLEDAFATALEYRNALDREDVLELIFIALDDNEELGAFVDRMRERYGDPEQEEAACASSS